MPPRLMSTFRTTADVLSPDGLWIAGLPPVSVSGVNERPTPKPGNHVCSSEPPGTRSCFTTTAAPATAIHATSPSAAHETLRTTHKEHLPVSVTCYASVTDHRFLMIPPMIPPIAPMSLGRRHIHEAPLERHLEVGDPPQDVPGRRAAIADDHAARLVGGRGLQHDVRATVRVACGQRKEALVRGGRVREVLRRAEHARAAQ